MHVTAASPLRPFGTFNLTGMNTNLHRDLESRHLITDCEPAD